jgi:hypothetical protein
MEVDEAKRITKVETITRFTAASQVVLWLEQIFSMIILA